MDEFCKERHLLIAPGGELRTNVDELLKTKKCERVVAAGLNSFMNAAWILPETDCILTGPSRLVKQIERAFPVRILTPPIKIPDITIVQVWHERNNKDLGHRWIRDHVRKILQD